ncbi:hypothetical protein B0H10DRAFT_1261688 [Mycena sp. CBHHK59/15]|nr:hypothetical protein B0H10DRAFT_1261688 [Mycena sp. CBHHK59/15]
MPLLFWHWFCCDLCSSHKYLAAVLASHRHSSFSTAVWRVSLLMALWWFTNRAKLRNHPQMKCVAHVGCAPSFKVAARLFHAAPDITGELCFIQACETARDEACVRALFKPKMHTRACSAAHVEFACRSQGCVKLQVAEMEIESRRCSGTRQHLFAGLNNGIAEGPVWSESIAFSRISY